MRFSLELAPQLIWKAVYQRKWVGKRPKNVIDSYIVNHICCEKCCKAIKWHDISGIYEVLVITLRIGNAPSNRITKTTQLQAKKAQLQAKKHNYEVKTQLRGITRISVD